MMKLVHWWAVQPTQNRFLKDNRTTTSLKLTTKICWSSLKQKMPIVKTKRANLRSWGRGLIARGPAKIIQKLPARTTTLLPVRANEIAPWTRKTIIIVRGSQRRALEGQKVTVTSQNTRMCCNRPTSIEPQQR